MAAAEADEVYRAIGLFFVEFSRLVFSMRVIIIEQLDTDPGVFAELALGEATASNITSAFFGICRAAAELDEKGVEAKIESRLKGEVVSDAIEQRNDLAHGDWIIDEVGHSRGLGVATVIRVRPARSPRKGGPLKAFTATPELLAGWAERVSVLRTMVAEYGAICIGSDPYGRNNIRPPDVFVMQGQDVVRAGPSASEFPPFT